MGLYNIISTVLSGLGYVLLTYKSSFILSQNPQSKASLLEPLGIKWIVFMVFLMFEPTLETILDIIPFGLLALLVVKCTIVLPENTLATYIFKRIERRLQKMQFQQYNTKLSEYTSKACKLFSVKFIQGAKNLAVYVKSNQLQQIYSELQNTLKTLEYKRMTVNIKTQIERSKIPSADDSIASIDPEDLEGTAPQPKQSGKSQSEVMNRISTIYLGNPKTQDRVHSVEADIMTVKPNKEKGIKPQYQKGKVSFSTGQKEITFKYISGREEKRILTQIKYVKMNMMVIELILEDHPSIVIKFQNEQDVFPWVKPVMNCLNNTN